MSLKFNPQELIKFGLIIFAIFSPFSISGAQIGFGIALLGWFLKILWAKKLSWQSSFWDKPILFYLLAVIISIIFSQNFLKSLSSFKDEWLILLFFLLVNNLDDLKFTRKLLDILIGISVIVAIYAIFQHYTGQDFYHQKILDEVWDTGTYRAAGNFSMPLTYGFYSMVISIISFCLGAFEKEKNKKIFYYAASLICVTGNLFTYTRSVLLAQIAAFLSFFYLCNIRKKRFELGMVAVYFVVMFIIDPLIFIRLREVSYEGTPFERLVIWGTSLRIFVDNLVTGIGFGNFMAFYEQYLKVPSKIFGHAHNDFLNVAVHAGIIGLSAFVWLWVKAWRSFRRIFQETEDERFKPLVLAGFLTVPAYLVASQFQCYYTDAIDNMIIFFVLGIAVSAGLIYQKRSTKQSNLA
ncbi:MAG: O-antigen ligase family protein [Candidatus Zixiibacteriota bacterium]